MSTNYPREMTDAAREKNKHISIEEILHDISDTQDEIAKLRECQRAYLVLSSNHLETEGRRMYSIRESAAQSSIVERQEFVRFLRMLLTDKGYDVAQLDRPIGAS